MNIDCIGLDTRKIDKKKGDGQWAISLVKFPNGDVAEVFLDAEDCVHFPVGANLSLECGLTVFDKKLGIRCLSLKMRDAGKDGK